MVKEFNVRTNSRIEFINIDNHVLKAVSESGVQEGQCIVFVPHTTAGVTINENADPDVRRDINTHLNKLIPSSGDYFHAEGNSDGHIKSSLIGQSLTLIVSNGKPVLGTWQSVFFCEFDGPRTRSVIIRVSS
ncbi:secondary thiamine-phosphate synthase enzyme YjbQ [candidate division KSB1 bacterium]